MLSVLTLVGCSEPKTAKVSGSVTFDGKPLPAGTISFLSEKGGAAVVGAIDDGRYVIAQVPIGPVQIAVVTEPPHPQMMSPDGKPVGGQPKPYVAIPVRYATVEKSDLKATVIKGEQTIPIDLKP